jgi:hypothetical protein
MFDYHIGYVFHQDHNENSPDPGGALKTVPQKCKVEPISMNIYIYNHISGWWFGTFFPHLPGEGC